jgi:hypothetical protein
MWSSSDVMVEYDWECKEVCVGNTSVSTPAKPANNVARLKLSDNRTHLRIEGQVADLRQNNPALFDRLLAEGGLSEDFDAGGGKMSNHEISERLIGTMQNGLNTYYDMNRRGIPIHRKFFKPHYAAHDTLQRTWHLKDILQRQMDTDIPGRMHHLV